MTKVMNYLWTEFTIWLRDKGIYIGLVIITLILLVLNKMGY